MVDPSTHNYLVNRAIRILREIPLHDYPRSLNAVSQLISAEDGVKFRTVRAILRLYRSTDGLASSEAFPFLGADDDIYLHKDLRNEHK